MSWTPSKPGWPWLPSSRGRIWLTHPDCRRHWGLFAGEVRILSIIDSLVTGAALHDLAGLLAGLDPRTLALVLAALGHAGGAGRLANWS
jgi:hypothetical protein